MILCGIDPGKTGAVAIVDYGQNPPIVRDFTRMPLCSIDGKDIVDSHSLANWIGQFILCFDAIDRVVIERVHGSAKQGAKNAFSFGMSYMAAIHAARTASADILFAVPRTWKRKVKVPGKSSDPQSKTLIRQRATEAFPTSSHLWEKQSDHDIAEAALLTLFTFC